MYSCVVLVRYASSASVLGRQGNEEHLQGNSRRPGSENSGGVKRLSGPSLWTGCVWGKPTGWYLAFAWCMLENRRRMWRSKRNKPSTRADNTTVIFFCVTVDWVCWETLNINISSFLSVFVFSPRVSCTGVKRLHTPSVEQTNTTVPSSKCCGQMSPLQGAWSLFNLFFNQTVRPTKSK